MNKELQEQNNQQVGMTTLAGFELGQRVAKMLASSNLVPQAYRGNLADCLIALNMAHRMGADPLQVLQNLVIVHGRPTWSSQFLIATFNSCGRFSSIKYQFSGEKNTDQWGCRAYATELATGELLEGPEVTIALAKSEGWYGKNGSKWKSIPELMMRYRAAAWFVRTVAPEISMGLHTQDEAIDTGEKEINPLPSVKRGKSVSDLIGDADIDNAEVTEVEPAKVVIETEPVEVIKEAEAVEIDNAVIIDEETGEISLDEYEDLRIAIRESETKSDLARIYKELNADAKAALKDDINTRQEQINRSMQEGLSA